MYNNRRVQEDLERIRRANQPSERLRETEEIPQKRNDAKSAAMRLTFKDILAMTIAVLSLVLPYVFLIGGAAVLFMFLFLR